MAQVTRLTLDNTGDLDRRRMHYREVADDADAPLASVGEDLRKARERRGEDLDHIARVLKIRQDYLAAVEEGTMEALPGKTYAMGFVRSYAAYLGLDGNQYVGRLKAEIAGRDDTEPPPTVTSPAERRWPQGGWIAGGLLFVALVYAGYLMLSAPETEQPVIPVPDRLAVEAGLPTAQQSPTPAAAAPASTEPAAPAAKSPVAAPPPAAGPASAPAAKAPAPAAQPTPAPAPQASAPAAPPPAVSPAVRTTPLVIASPLPQGRRYGVQNTNARITLRVHREAHVTVRGADNRMFINRTLQPGDTYLVPNLGGLRLSAPDAGAVELLLDGSSVGFAGQNGVANDLPLSVQAVLERLNPG